MQVPPMYAALHHEGRRLHELAREGITVERAARPITIERLTLLDWSAPVLTLDITCSKGTYIRSLARDIGETLGCGAYLQALRRTAVGTFTIEQAVPLDALVMDQENRSEGHPETSDSLTSAHRPAPLTEVLLPPELAVLDWPAAYLGSEQIRRVRNGQAIELEGIDGDRARAHGPDGALLALLAAQGHAWKPLKVFDWT
jgi:tRNA pseudouridine55 synthase